MDDAFQNVFIVQPLLLNLLLPLLDLLLNLLHLLEEYVPLPALMNVLLREFARLFGLGCHQLRDVLILALF